VSLGLAPSGFGELDVGIFQLFCLLHQLLEFSAATQILYQAIRCSTLSIQRRDVKGGQEQLLGTLAEQFGQ
jgi:hypothetical protein